MHAIVPARLKPGVSLDQIPQPEAASPDAQSSALIRGRALIIWDPKAPAGTKKLDAIDTDRDGQLSRHELQAWKKAHRGERQAKAAEHFKHADTNGDGKISRAEAEKNAPRLAKKFDIIDANKDGQLTPEELRAYRESKRSHKEKV
mgnify:CR=1 FL=1